MGINPSGRHISRGKRDLDLIEGMEVHFIAAPTLGLQHAEKAGALHVGDGLIWNSALAPALERALGKRGDHRARTGNDLRRLGRYCRDMSRRLHGVISRRRAPLPFVRSQSPLGVAL